MPARTDKRVKQAWGEALYFKRWECKMTQQLLTAQVGVTDATVSSYESGRAIPNVIVAQRIVKALDWTVEEWAREAERRLNDETWTPYHFPTRFRDGWGGYYGKHP